MSARVWLSERVKDFAWFVGEIPIRRAVLESPLNLFMICSERSSAGRRAAQKPQFTGVNEDFEQRMSLDHGLAVRS
jgi:hypothetical protein